MFGDMLAKNEILRLFATVCVCLVVAAFAAFTAAIVAVKLSCVNEMRLRFFLAGTKRNLQLAEAERKLLRLPLENIYKKNPFHAAHRPLFATVIKCSA